MKIAESFSGESLADRVFGDLQELRPGCPSAMVHIRVKDSSGALRAPEQIGQLQAELPSKAQLDVRDSGLFVWLPRTPRNSATQVARLLRTLVLQKTLRSAEVGAKSSTVVSCAIGVVMIERNNWDPAAISGTAEVTSAMAALNDVSSICFADQLSNLSVSAN